MQPLRMPVLFVGHGNPMNTIQRNEFHQRWQELGRLLPKPKSILCMFAHWETRGVCLSAAEEPETLQDFFGFPKAQFDACYPAPGDPALADRAKELMGAAGTRLRVLRDIRFLGDRAHRFLEQGRQPGCPIV